MNEIATLKTSKTIHTGTLTFGKGKKLDDNSYTMLFRIRKTSMDFMGQITLILDEESVRLEMFNDVYFNQFNLPQPLLEEALKNRVLKGISGNPLVPEAFRILASETIKFKTLKPKKAEPPLREMNVKVDLTEIFDHLNRDYFEGKIQAKVIWGKDSKTTNKRGFRFGSYEDRKKLIRIHPRLKQSFVPLSVIELTVYHEMCHQWTPPVRRKSQWRSHHQGFKDKEKEYQFYQEAKAWEKDHWKRLLNPVAPVNA
jgi:hypothetical protein